MWKENELLKQKIEDKKIIVTHVGLRMHPKIEKGEQTKKWKQKRETE